MNDFIYLGSIDSYLNLQEPSNFLRTMQVQKMASLEFNKIIIIIFFPEFTSQKTLV